MGLEDLHRALLRTDYWIAHATVLCATVAPQETPVSEGETVARADGADPAAPGHAEGPPPPG